MYLLSGLLVRDCPGIALPVAKLLPKNSIAFSEAAQGNYMQQVGSSAMAAAGLPRMPTFQELSQQTLYGTGSPNYLSQFYQLYWLDKNKTGFRVDLYLS